MPGFVPPYQNVIAIADKANAANARGKWKRVNISSSSSAPVTEAIANPYGIARDTSRRAIHFVTLRLAIIQQFFIVWIWVSYKGHPLVFVSIFTLARFLSVYNACNVRWGRGLVGQCFRKCPWEARSCVGSV